jgi:hypothetical protein
MVGGDTMRISRLGFRAGLCFLCSALVAADGTGAQESAWAELIAAADSIGPVPPLVSAAPDFPCGAGVQRADSVRVSAAPREFLFAARSLRTRGVFTHPILPATGAGTFALREIRCDEHGRPLTFELEREHRYFLVVFSLQESPTFQALTFLTMSGEWTCFRWQSGAARFSPGQCHASTGAKC